MEKDKLVNWINSVIDGVADLPDNNGKKVLEYCGRQCSCMMGTARKAKEIRKKVKNPKNIQLLLDAFKENIFMKSPLYLQDDIIILEYTHSECGCPVVQDAGIKNPIMCNCTMGHTKAMFEALLDRPVEITLEKSNLLGDAICRQAIKPL